MIGIYIFKFHINHSLKVEPNSVASLKLELFLWPSFSPPPAYLTLKSPVWDANLTRRGSGT